MKIYTHTFSSTPFRRFTKSFFRNIGWEIEVFYKNPSNSGRKLGDMELFMEDISARKFAPKSILDVGANHAKWSALAKQYFPNAEFYLIDPQSEVENDLKAFCSITPKAKYFLKGAGAKECKLLFTTPTDGSYDGAANFLEKPNKDLIEKGLQKEVDIITIDSLIESGKIKIPDLVKMDVQGFELEALKGANKLFGETALFILEVSLFRFSEGIPLFHEVIAFMKEKGYIAYDFPGYGRRPYDGAVGQIDIAFVKENGFFRQTNSW